MSCNKIIQHVNPRDVGLLAASFSLPAEDSNLPSFIFSK